jgi:hypothetical protein
MQRGNVFKQIVTHHQSQDDGSHHIPQHLRLSMELLYAPFVFRVNGLSTEAELNANGTI